MNISYRPAVMYTSPEWDQPWALNSVGQIFRVVAVNGNRVVLDPPLHIGFDSRLHPVTRPQGLLENAGLENLHIRRKDTSDTHMVTMQNVANVWVARVVSELAAKSHVSVDTGFRVEVRDSDFRDATNHGDGGHGYGVELSVHTTSTLVENNMFRRLRHSMMVQVGANGNVFGYNYSREPQWQLAALAPDISVHGHYPFANLFEGNIVQRAGVSDWWGPAGPHNLFFRNRFEQSSVILADASNGQNIVGNELFRTIVRDGTVDPSTLTVHGNSVNGVVSWDPAIADRDVPASYYLDAKPDFFGEMAWPSTGADRPGGINPAYSRYLGETSGAPGQPGTPTIAGNGHNVVIKWSDPVRRSK